MTRGRALPCLIIVVAFASRVLACTSADERRSGSTARNVMTPGDASEASAADSGKASSPARLDAARPVDGDHDGGQGDEGDAAITGTPSPQLASCLEEHHIELVPLDSLRAVAREIARIEARCAPAPDELARIATRIGGGL